MGCTNNALAIHSRNVAITKKNVLFRVGRDPPLPLYQSLSSIMSCHYVLFLPFRLSF